MEFQRLDEEKQRVFGWASVAIDDGGEIVSDWADDRLDLEALEESAYKFVTNSRTAGENHEKDEYGKKRVGEIIESLYLTPEKAAALGFATEKVGWWIGVQVEDADVWAKVKDGTYRAFSIGGRGYRTTES